MNKKDDIPVLLPGDPLGRYGLMPSELDPFGSYTGVSRDMLDIPLQDADDL